LKNDISLTDDRTLFKSLLKLAVPIMLSNLLQMLYNLADAYFLGKLGKEALAAPAVSFNLIFFLVVFGLGFSMAGTTLIAQSRGKNDREKMDYYLGQMAGLVTIISVVISILGLLLSNPLLKLLQVPKDAFTYTYQYITIIFAGMPFMFMIFILQASMQGIGDSVTPLIIQFFTVLMNITLDPLLIFGIGFFPKLEVQGAAIATVFSRFSGSVAALIILIHGKKGLKLKLQNMKPKKSAVSLLFKIGFPASIGQGISALGFAVLQGLVNSFGTAVVAAFGIGTRVIGLFNMPALGMARATTSMVGRCLGAKKADLAKKVVKQAVISIFIFISISMSLTFFFGASVIRFFVDEQEVIQHGSMMFKIISVSVVAFALFTVITGAFQGGGDTKPIMYLNIGRLWGFRVPLAFLLSVGLMWGPVGIWVSMFISNFAIALIGFLYLKKGKWLIKIDPDTI
jgi:putative MATE family efflux protein